MRTNRIMRGAERVLLIVGALLIGFSVGAYIIGRVYQALENRRLEAALHSSKRHVPAPSHRHPRRPIGSLVGRIEIPRLRLSAIVLEGSDNGTLRLGVGRIPQTADPGQVGNVVLGGHRDTFFRPLQGIRAGDVIGLVTPDALYRYVVEWTQVVDPTNVALLQPTPDRSLTLVTCYPFHFIGPAPQRFIVRARQVASQEVAMSRNSPSAKEVSE